MKKVEPQTKVRGQGLHRSIKGEGLQAKLLSVSRGGATCRFVAAAALLTTSSLCRRNTDTHTHILTHTPYDRGPGGYTDTNAAGTTHSDTPTCFRFFISLNVTSSDPAL